MVRGGLGSLRHLVEKNPKLYGANGSDPLVDASGNWVVRDDVYLNGKAFYEKKTAEEALAAVSVSASDALHVGDLRRTDVAGGREATVSEAADLLFHLLVLLRHQSIGLDDLFVELAARRKPPPGAADPPG